MPDVPRTMNDTILELIGWQYSSSPRLPAPAPRAQTLSGTTPVPVPIRTGLGLATPPSRARGRRIYVDGDRLGRQFQRLRGEHHAHHQLRRRHVYPLSARQREWLHCRRTPRAFGLDIGRRGHPFRASVRERNRDAHWLDLRSPAQRRHRESGTRRIFSRLSGFSELSCRARWLQCLHGVSLVHTHRRRAF